ncbi:Serine carboxypeptidase-like [Trema orientale]|uniref:Serine carboxypeptidase-like n=1 Tax=Trema orientale TaxID=63057 RepID=A0A2P5G0X3_TREOI|nr:Serine carboxypeptidase-like [Trema orientale]
MAKPRLYFILGLSTLDWYRRILLLLLSASTVKYLPGFQGPLPFHLETGYVGVGESENVQLFYYFVKSERNPEKDPLLLWLTGGPGCSGWSALVYEIGPLNYKIEPYNGSLPTLVLNQYSWTKVSNIIFVDSPVTTGFSYAKTSLAYDQLGDFNQVRYLLQFIKKWLINHTEFISNPLYIAGDSYSGIIVPPLVQQISNGIKEGSIPPLDLKGYILGNPVTDRSNDNTYQILFGRGMALISDEIYQLLEKSCGGEYKNISPNNTMCLKAFEAYQKCISGINQAHILEPHCAFASPKPQNIIKGRSLNQYSEVFLHSDPLPQFGCREYDQLLSRYWANDFHVREALHTRKGSIGEWRRCSDEVQNHYKYEVFSSFQYHAKLSAQGYRSLIYSGDHDMMVPYLETQAWIKSLNYSIVDDWRPWIVQGQVAG